MKRYEFKAGMTLMGWCPVTASLELRTSIGTILDLESGDLDAELRGPMISRAKEIFQENRLAITPTGPPE